MAVLPLGPRPAQAPGLSPSPHEPVAGGNAGVVPEVALQSEEMELLRASVCG